MQQSIAKKNATRQVTPLQEVLLRIALSLRVSTDDQTDRKTIEGQVDFLRTWASLYGFPIAGVYADDGISGTIPLHERPDGARLLQDAPGSTNSMGGSTLDGGSTRHAWLPSVPRIPTWL
jgi:hypothetical protein